MNKNLNAVLKASGYAALTLIIINLIYFGIEIYNTGTEEISHAGFKNAAFYINDKVLGFELKNPKAILIMLLVFVYIMRKEYQKGNLTLNNNRLNL